MAAYFFDTSALVKHYVREAGSEWVKALFALREGHDVYISVLTPAEVAAALERRERDGSLPRGSASVALSRIRDAMDTRLTFVEPNFELIDLAMKMATTYALRGADAFQLANALCVARERQKRGLSQLTLVAADDDLNVAAEAEGLIVENPNLYP